PSSVPGESRESGEPSHRAHPRTVVHVNGRFDHCVEPSCLKFSRIVSWPTKTRSTLGQLLVQKAVRLPVRRTPHLRLATCSRREGGEASTSRPNRQAALRLISLRDDGTRVAPEAAARAVGTERRASDTHSPAGTSATLKWHAESSPNRSS